MGKRYTKQLGIGLIELLISLALGLFLLSGAIAVLVSGKSSYNLNSELTWVQDNARFALSILRNDIRMAGFFGCGTGADINFTSTLNPSAGSNWQFDFEKSVFGWDGDDDAYPVSEFPAPYNSGAVVNMPNSDMLTIRRGGGENSNLADNYPPTAAAIDMVGTHPFDDGDILVITDCEQTTVFQVTGHNSQQIVHNTGTGSPGNCTKLLGNSRCVTAPVNNKVFYGDDGAFILRLSAHAYYVDEGADGTPSLFHREVVASSGDSETEDEELVQGVENLQVLYGLDITFDGYVNKYVNAEDISDSDWGFVSTVRLHILFRSFVEVTSAPQEFRFFGVNYTPADRFFRQEFITTVQIRNK